MKGLRRLRRRLRGLTARVLEHVLGMGICGGVRIFSRELGGTVKRDQWRGALMNENFVELSPWCWLLSPLKYVTISTFVERAANVQLSCLHLGVQGLREGQAQAINGPLHCHRGEGTFLRSPLAISIQPVSHCTQCLRPIHPSGLEVVT